MLNWERDNMILSKTTYKAGNVTVYATDVFKSETEEDLSRSAQNLIAKLICRRESNETTTYYAN